MNIALVLAAGMGRRMGTKTPKQFLEVGGKPILAHTLSVFQRHSEIDALYVVCPEESRATVLDLVRTYEISKLREVIAGGQTRRESSYNGVRALERICKARDIILIHDGVRPNVSGETIAANIAMAKESGACVTAVETSDTIIVSEDGQTLTAIPPRRFLWNVQTPQSFQYGVIRKAHDYYQGAVDAGGADLPDITDDTGLVLFMEAQCACGQKVGICKGNAGNLKVTTPEDLRILLSVLPQGEDGLGKT